ncbi:MAG TPA: pilus assembly protein N-terminal domain-containing protein [Polyangiaceae bacterium]|nr:pilus assembly protein N-terminal domain-containing protein [Polyangiaceae bacterium]
MFARWQGARSIAFGLTLAAAAFCDASAAFAQPTATVPRNASATSNTEPRVEDIDLQVGEQRVIPADNVRSYSEGQKGVLDVRLTKDASQFVVVALAEGSTTLLFLMLDGTERHYRIHVTDKNAPKRRGRGTGSIEARDNIRLDFYFVQLSKNYAHQIGIGFPGSVAPTFSAAYNVAGGQLESATAVISSQALPRLDMGQSAGWAKVQRQAAVVTANGEKASFSGGGEVNVPVQSALASGIQKISFGSVIETEPNYDSQTGRIELRLHADISELEGDRGTGIPGRTTAELDTVVNLELGQSLILAGLTAKSERSSKTGLPGLSQIPFIGALFGSHGHSEEETENIVIIVPSVVDAVSMEDRRRLDDALKAYTDYSGNLEKVDFVPRTKPTGRRATGASGTPATQGAR